MYLEIGLTLFVIYIISAVVVLCRYGDTIPNKQTLAVMLVPLINTLAAIKILTRLVWCTIVYAMDGLIDC